MCAIYIVSICAGYHTCRAVGLTTWFNSTAADFCAVIHHCDAVDSITPQLIDSSIFYYMFTCNNIIIECIHIVEVRSALRINERDQNICIQQQQGYRLYYCTWVKCQPAANRTHFSGFESTGCKWMRIIKNVIPCCWHHLDYTGRNDPTILFVFDWFSRETSYVCSHTHILIHQFACCVLYHAFLICQSFEMFIFAIPSVLCV